jgi:hypothetical protein
MDTVIISGNMQVYFQGENNAGRLEGGGTRLAVLPGGEESRWKILDFRAESLSALAAGSDLEDVISRPALVCLNEESRVVTLLAPTGDPDARTLRFGSIDGDKMVLLNSSFEDLFFVGPGPGKIPAIVAIVE